MIPSGPNYNNSTFQGCVARGASSQMGVDGDDYLRNEFGFGYHNVGRNFGILIVFTAGFLLLNMWLVEKLDWALDGGAIHEYASSNNRHNLAKNIDEESTDDFRVQGVIQESSTQRQGDKLNHSGATFTWHNLNYSVPHKHGEKQLLQDVSGFCEPGKLTALVGASGAGKSTCE